MKHSDDARKAIHDRRWGPYIHDPVERQDADDKMIKMVIDTFNQLEAELATFTNSLEMTWGVILQRNPSVGGHISYAAERGFQKLEARLASARAIMQKFVDKVDRGMARSIETYAEMTEWLEEE